MKDSNLDLFDPRTVVMDTSAYSPSTCHPDFGFAFNDKNFSDRILRIEVLGGCSPDETIIPSTSAGLPTLADWVLHHKRPPRQDIKKHKALDLTEYPEEQILKCIQADNDDTAAGDNQDEEEFAMIEDANSGDEAPNNDDFGYETDAVVILKIITLHISSPILAAKSPFFYKLFSNGTKEAEDRYVTLQIQASDEASLMELLNFMYSNTLQASTAPALLDVLMAADKFEVASCMRYCGRLLCNLPMTAESALLYLDLPSSATMAEAVQPLTDAAKQFLADRYKDITKFQDEIMGLSLAGIEAVLASDDLQVASEDVVYDIVLKWARARYPKLDERMEILTSRLCQYIRFPFMTCRKLRKVLACNDLEYDRVSKFVVDGLLFKADVPHRQRGMAAESMGVHHRYLERAYKYRPVKVVEFEVPRQQCIVYLDLKREECAGLFPSGRVYSQAFHLGGQGFFLSAHCNLEQQSSSHCFGLFLGMQEKGSVTFSVEYEFSARSKQTEEYASKYKGTYKFTGGKAVGYRNLFAIPWTSFIAEDSLQFINGVLHLKADLTMKP